jgi:hypothetical protein
MLQPAYYTLSLYRITLGISTDFATSIFFPREFPHPFAFCLLPVFVALLQHLYIYVLQCFSFFFFQVGFLACLVRLN